MQAGNRSAIIAAAVIMGGFGLLAFHMPAIMMAIGNISTVAAVAVAVLFVAAFFLIFRLRGCFQKQRTPR